MANILFFPALPSRPYLLDQLFRAIWHFLPALTKVDRLIFPYSGDDFALLDADQAARDPQRAERARRTAADNNITIIWQDPCFEAVLLRHLDGKTGHRPPDTPGAVKALQKEWVEYAKPMSRANLAKRIDRAAVLRAAAVEPELEALLRCLDLI